MIKRTLNELKSYEAPGHFNMTAMRIHGKEETGAQKFCDSKIHIPARRRCRVGV